MRILRALLLFGLLTLLAWMGYSARAVLLPFLLAGVLAYMTNPLVSFLQRRGVRRSTAVSLLYAVVFLALVAGSYWLLSVWWQDLPRLRYQWPGYMQSLQKAADQIHDLLARQWPWLGEKLAFKGGLDKATRWVQGGLQESAVRYISVLFYAGLNAVFVPFVAFFMLRSGPAVSQNLLNACPGRWVEKLLGLLNKADEVVGNYIRGVLMDSLLVAALAGLGLYALGVQYAGVIALVMCFCNLVPYLGAFVGGGLAVTAAFLQYESLGVPLRVVALFLLLRFLDDWVFQPLILKRALNLHPVVILFALLCGGEVAGFWGLVLSVPAVCIAKETAAILWDWYLAESGRFRVPPALTRAAAKPWAI